MTSIDWMPNGGAPLLPKVSPYCVPVKMMELKRRPTLYDIRGSGFQLRHYKARPGDVVPWDRVFFWPPKQVHVITDREVYKPAKRKRKKRVSKKGPKVVKAPATPARDKKFAAKFVVRYDFQRVLRYLDVSADKRAVKAASADAAKAPTRAIFSGPLTLPGAFSNDDDDTAADVDAQTQSAADEKAQPSLLAAIFNFGFGLLFGPRQSKRALEDDDVAGDAKRRRVGSDAQAPSRAEARPVAGKAARSTTTGATAQTNHNNTANAAQRRARIAPKASLLLCPPPSGSASVAGNAKAVKALLMPPPLARPIAGRATRKRADTPDPRAGTPPPAEHEASSAASTPTTSPSSSRASSPEPSQSPAPAPKDSSSKSKSKSKSTRCKSSKSKSKSSSESQSSSSESDASSAPQESSTKSKSKSKSSETTSSASKDKLSSSKDKSSSSKTKSSSKDKLSSSGSTSSSSESTSSSSDSESPPSTSRHSHKSRRSSPEPVVKTGNLMNTGTNIMLFPYTLRWSREGEQVNPWDPRCPAAPDPRFPWAPASSTWAQARPAPITMSSSTAASTISFKHPASFHDSARAPSAAAPSAPHSRAASPAPEDFSGYETEVDSGEETDDEED